MLNKILRTDDEYASLVLRVMLGLVFFPHGAQKLFGWFGGNGFSATMGFFTTQAGIPTIFAFLAIMAESVGALALIAGFFTRVAALGIAVNMVICALANHLQHGFFMNWFGQQKGEGFEFHILAVALAAGLIIKGGGRWSVDGVLSKNG
ncbi:MAG: DoxX family protein [Nitrospirota bacterium]|nr:MAG: DoxX family protein [Nitrospirota bacterium]